MTTTAANLLAQKQQLLEGLEEGPGLNERDQVQGLLARIDTALNLLNEPVSAPD